jgi:HAE1 family hydrophobic/amphiphilic exporter-1
MYQLVFSEGASVLKVQPEIDKVLEANKAKIQVAGNDFVILSDVSEAIRDQVKEIEEGAIGLKIGDSFVGNLGYLLGGIWLIVLAMLLFVSWRAALISAAAVPLSLLFTFIALKLQGVSLNTLTLFSMVLVLGLIVDPAIVVLEAIQRELDHGKRGKDAVIAAMNTIGLGVFMAVFTSIIVFIPFGVVSGIFGQIIKFIPITIIPALLASYFVPVLFLTFLAQRYLRPAKVVHDEESVENLWKVSQWFVKVNMAVSRRRWAQWIIVILAVVTPLVVSGSLFATGKVVPVQFSAPKDAPEIAIQLEFPRNLSMEGKRALQLKLEEELVKHTYIDRYFPLQQSETMMMLLAPLLPRDERSDDSPELATALTKDLQAVLQKPENGVFVTARSNNVGTPEAAFPVSLNIFGDNLADLKKAAIASGDFLREQDKVTRVDDGFTGRANPQISITLNRDKLGQFGLPAVQVAGAMSSIIGSSTVTKFEQTVDGAPRTTEVLLSSADVPSSPDAIRDTVIASTAKGLVRLKDVATVAQEDGFTGINRLNGSRFVTVGAQVEDALKDATGVQAKLRDFWTPEKLASFNLRSDALESRGSNDEFVKSFSELFMALGLSIILLYISLVIFLKSFFQPLIILFAVPLTFIGVFPALTLVGGQFGFLEILGIITLSGIVVNVGIFVIDLANQKRDKGTDYKLAIAEATGVRFRPIFLTKITALAGLAPLMVLSPFWRSLAVVVVSGILVSGFLSLFTTPVLYIWHADIKRFFGRMGVGIRRRFAK